MTEFYYVLATAIQETKSRATSKIAGKGSVLISVILAP